MPKTNLGKWSLGLIIAMLILFALGSSFIGGRPALVLTMLAGMASGVSAFITGLIAIIKQKDRTILVYVATIIGAILIVFLIGEVLFPH